MVEHSLCPLDPRRSMVENLVHEVTHQYSDSRGRRKIAQAKVLCPLGLSACDELYLWGLLSLTLENPKSEGRLIATPHWCLRRLGLIDQKTSRGGRQYGQFSAALRRLAAVTYFNDAFYDPVREEHREVTFHMFSVSLPLDRRSSRAWRILWDPVFFEMVSAAAGQFRFDLSLYRGLSPAARRLLLFAEKIFARRPALPVLELRTLSTDLLGFSPTLETRNARAKVKRCIRELQDVGVIGEAEFTRTRQGAEAIRMTAGSRPRPVSTRPGQTRTVDSPVWASLVALGLDAGAIRRLVGQYPEHLLVEWVDITQAAEERFGPKFFRRSRQAYFVDAVSKAAKGQRTPPDWWQELRKSEIAQSVSTGAARDLLRRIGHATPRPSQVEGQTPASASGDGLSTVGDVLATL